MILIITEAIILTLVIDTTHTGITGIASPVTISGLNPIRLLMTAPVPASSKIKQLLSLLTAGNKNRNTRLWNVVWCIYILNILENV